MRDTRTLLSKLCDPMRIKGQRSWFIVQAYSRGDTYLTCALMEAFRAQHGHVANDIVLIIKRSHAPIAAMFERHCSRIVTLDDHELDRLAGNLKNMGYRTELVPDQAVFLHPHHMDDGRADALTILPEFSQKNMYQHFLRLPFDAPMSKPLIPSAWQKEADSFAKAHKMPPRRSVILLPDANSYPAVETHFWEELTKGLHEAGWTVFSNLFGTNATRRSQAFPGSIGITPPFNILLPLAEHAGWVISTLTGAMNILITAQAKCRKTVVAKGPIQGTKLRFNDLIELDSAFPYASQKTFDGEAYNIEEFEVRCPEDYMPIVKQICEGFNSSSPQIPSAEPVTRFSVDTSPGDILDRVTILELKEQLLSGPSVMHNIRRELQMLRGQLTKPLGQPKDDLRRIVTDLKAVNRTAWNTNEEIFKGFADEFGSQQWKLDIRDPATIARAESMIRAFRKSQQLNRERVALKNKANQLLASSMIEEKSYADPLQRLAETPSNVKHQAPLPEAPQEAALNEKPTDVDALLSEAGLYSVQFELSSKQRDTVARAIAEQVNQKVPRLNRPVNSQALRALSTEGGLSLGQVFTPSQANDIVQYFKQTPCFGAHVAAYSDGIARPVEEAAQIGEYGSYRLCESLAAPHLLELALREDILGLCDHYLGCLPTLYSIHTWWTFAGRPRPGQTHHYHRDQDDHRFLALFVYLTDVGPEDGPIDLLLGTHRLDVVESALAEYRHSNPGVEHVDAERLFPQFSGNGYGGTNGKIPIPYDHLFAKHKATLTGKAGTGFLADTFALHKGTPPTRQHRLACWIRFGLAKQRIYVIDKTRRVPASTLNRQIPNAPQTDWVTRLIIDKNR